MIYVIIAIALIAVLLFFVSRQPAEFKVTRSMAMKASPSTVFAHVNDLGKWQAWSPWARMEPDAATTYDGPMAGLNASMSWVGKKTGEGRMTIIDSVPDSLIKFRLDFKKPMQATNIAEFTFTPQGDQTNVTWTMTGTNSFMGKLIGLVLNCEKMVGGQFMQGLSNLRTIVE
jgi:hypothetical protein